MAPAIQYQVPRLAPAETTAHEELERLLETCHRHGLLRLANDLVAANKDIAQIIVGGLQKPGTLNALQNLAVLLMALSCIPPAEFYRLVFALADGMARVAGVTRAPGPDAAARGPDAAAPGLAGLYRMLHDEPLWRGVAPLLEGLKAFAEGLGRTVENPVSDFTGKPGRAS